MKTATAILAAIAASLATATLATDVNVIGLFPGKALVVIDRGAPRMLAVGQRTPEGVVLLSADSRAAELEIDGRRERLEMGRHFETSSAASGPQHVTLAPDGRGHFSAEGAINDAHVRFLVDTGATFVTLPAAEAARLGIDAEKGRPAVSQTANGNVLVRRVTLDRVKVGDITLYNVDAVVQDGPGLDMTLLGMSFLNRTEMRADGANLVLTKRY
ncbi:MAG TPA: TIGR02281 family clan AA aspartic protease [Usitatibacter sp.]|nr:TIGR02281 family clan AA aspartic protease [Usitatibacter sp.]